MFFEKKFWPRRRSCPGQVASSPKNKFLENSSAPGSETAWDKWLPPNKTKQQLSGKNMSQAAKLPQTSGFFQKKVTFLEQVLPQAAKLPRTSGFRQKMEILKTVLPQAAQLPLDKWLGREKATNRCSQGRGAPFWGPGGGAPRKAGCGGCAAPRLPPPGFEPN